MSKSYCLLVDPYVASQMICEALTERDLIPIAALSDFNISDEEKKLRLPAELFAKIVKFETHHLDRVVAELAEYPIVRVIAGYEESVDSADQLAEKICPLYANSSHTSLQRKQKYAMQEAVRAAKLPAVKQMKVTLPFLDVQQQEALTTWNFPVIVKPDQSSGSIGVNYCYNLNDINKALSHVIGYAPEIGAPLTTAVVQECLSGQEYFVDTVSLNGQHALSSIQRYHKTLHNNIPIYRYSEIVEPSEPAAMDYINYVKGVLDAIQLKYNFAHTELFLTPNGPCLLEINPRISGAHGFGNKLAWLTNQRSQAKLLAESIAAPETFLQQCQEMPRLSKFGRSIFLQSWQSKVVQPFALDKIQSLVSFHEFLPLKAVGTEVHPPKTLLDTVAMVMLAHADQEQVLKDYEKLAQLEEQGELF